jgi:hypothetical protein
MRITNIKNHQSKSQMINKEISNIVALLKTMTWNAIDTTWNID